MTSATTDQAATDSTTPIRVIADNLMRRVLRIQDPSNPLEVAEGLGRAYPMEQAELEEEIRGLPVTAPMPVALAVAAPSMTGRELAYAQDNIKRDLDFLVGSSQLKEVRVELQGWGETIRQWLADGAAAASLALDSGARDRVFSARRILLDYARVARLVGAMTPGLSIAYRRLARSIDEASGLLLVALGEAMAQIGFSGDRLLLQAPASELGARAETAISALRNLTGTVSGSYTPSGWPWGLDAYRRLLNEIETAGHGDVRVLLQESGLRAFADELINQSASITGDGLRTLAATHVVSLDRLERLILIGQRLQKDAPPLASFISALRLFLDAFTGGTSSKLIALGRPLLSASWLYSFGGLDRGSAGTLFNLIRNRGEAAQLHDSLYGLQLKRSDVRAQFEADNCLYLIDLAINLYAVGMGTKDLGTPEMRAATHGFLIWQLLGQERGISDIVKNSENVLLPQTLPTPSIATLQTTLMDTVGNLLSGVYDQAIPMDGNSPPPADLKLDPKVQDVLAQELGQIEGSFPRLHALAEAMTPGNFTAQDITKPTVRALKAVRRKITGRTPLPIASTDLPPPVESTLAEGLDIIDSLVPPTAPRIDRITIFPNDHIAVDGTGFVNVLTVLLGRTEGDRHEVPFTVNSSVSITVPFNKDLTKRYATQWAIAIVTVAGTATASSDQSTRSSLSATS